MRTSLKTSNGEVPASVVSRGLSKAFQELKLVGQKAPRVAEWPMGIISRETGEVMNVIKGNHQRFRNWKPDQ